MPQERHFAKRGGVGATSPTPPRLAVSASLRLLADPPLEGEGYLCEGVNRATSVWLSAA